MFYSVPKKKQSSISMPQSITLGRTEAKAHKFICDIRGGTHITSTTFEYIIINIIYVDSGCPMMNNVEGKNEMKIISINPRGWGG